MADPHTRMNIFETFDNYDCGYDEDFQASDPNEIEISEDDGCK